MANAISPPSAGPLAGGRAKRRAPPFPLRQNAAFGAAQHPGGFAVPQVNQRRNAAEHRECKTEYNGRRAAGAP